MSRLTPIAAFVFLLFFFFFVSRSIISTRLLELKYQISREQLMNYELSSRVLREKFKQLIYRGKEDFKTEVKFSVLESSIMNAGNIKTEETSLSQVFGLHIINMVRRLSLKGRLDFLENEKNILLLQYAFYLERTKKYASANKRYSDLERILGNSAGEERAFIFLHNGFCLALTGKIPEAIEKLSYAEERFPGTSYSENAKILKKLILEAEEKKKIIFSGSKTPAEKAVALFDSGNYASAFDELAKVEFLSVKDSFLKARIYEETGQSPLAVPEYLRLISENKDPVISKKANRRLMLIGNFFEENREIAKLSRETAKTLGDTEAIAQVEKGAALVMKSQVKEEILRLEEKEPGKTGDNSLQELKKEIESEVKIKEKETMKAMKISRKTVPAIESGRPLEIMLEFKDGRKFHCSSVEIENNKIRLNSEFLKISIPVSMLKQISLTGGTENSRKEERIKLEFNSGEEMRARALKHSGTSFIILRNGEEKEISESQLKRISF